MTDDKQPREPDPYYDNIMKLVFGYYKDNKEVARQLILRGTVVCTIMIIAYNLLVYDKIIDPIDGNKTERALYLLNLI